MGKWWIGKKISIFASLLLCSKISSPKMASHLNKKQSNKKQPWPNLHKMCVCMSLVWTNDLLSVFMSWLLPCGLLVPLATVFLLLYCWDGEGCVASPPSLLEVSSSLPEELCESDELLPLLLLICSIISTSALNSSTKGYLWKVS